MPNQNRFASIRNIFNNIAYIIKNTSWIFYFLWHQHDIKFIRISVFKGHKSVVEVQNVSMFATAQEWKKLSNDIAKFYSNPKYLYSNTSSVLLSWNVSKLSFTEMLNVEQPWLGEKKRERERLMFLFPPWKLYRQIFVIQSSYEHAVKNVGKKMLYWWVKWMNESSMLFP